MVLEGIFSQSRLNSDFNSRFKMDPHMKEAYLGMFQVTVSNNTYGFLSDVKKN